MYPYPVLFGFNLYDILIFLGVIGALAVFRIYADKVSMPVRLQNLVLIDGTVSAVFGYFSAVLFQSCYNYLGAIRDAIASGLPTEGISFELGMNTGSTFFGGLIGGFAFGFAVYFGVGHFLFKKDKAHLVWVRKVAEIAVCAVTLAHAMGRLGCFTAGCCAGKEAEWGLSMLDYVVVDGNGEILEYVFHKVVPIQLFEALFLFCLFAAESVLFFKKFQYVPSFYMVVYGVWRFFIEYARGDERGATIVSFLTPSQLVAVLLFAAGVVLFFVLRKIDRKKQRSEKTLTDA